MRTENLSYDMKSARWSAPFPAMDSPRTMVLAFGESDLSLTPEVMRELRAAYPNSLVAGCSASGEIVDLTVRDKVVSVSVVKFTNTPIAAAVAECRESKSSFAVGESLAKKLNKPLLRSVFVLSDGLNVNGSELVRGLNSVLD